MPFLTNLIEAAKHLSQPRPAEEHRANTSKLTPSMNEVTEAAGQIGEIVERTRRELNAAQTAANSNPILRDNYVTVYGEPESHIPELQAKLDWALSQQEFIRTNFAQLNAAGPSNGLSLLGSVDISSNQLPDTSVDGQSKGKKYVNPYV